METVQLEAEAASVVWKTCTDWFGKKRHVQGLSSRESELTVGCFVYIWETLKVFE